MYSVDLFILVRNTWQNFCSALSLWTPFLLKLLFWYYSNKLWWCYNLCHCWSKWKNFGPYYRFFEDNKSSYQPLMFPGIFATLLLNFLSMNFLILPLIQFQIRKFKNTLSSIAHCITICIQQFNNNLFIMIQHCIYLLFTILFFLIIKVLQMK